MNEYYRLVDIDNRDENGAAYEIKATSLAEFIPYVAGPVRSDMIGPISREKCDEAIDYLRRERFDLAEQTLREECGVYLYTEWGETDDE